MNLPNKSNAAKSTVCTCLQLRKAARRISQIYDRHLEPYDLTINQYALLGYVQSFDGIGIGALAEKLVMDPTTLTRSLRPLELRGLVVVASDPRDRRNRNLHMTDAGRSQRQKARPGWEAAQHQVAEVLGHTDRDILTDTIDRMLEKLG